MSATLRKDNFTYNFCPTKIIHHVHKSTTIVEYLVTNIFQQVIYRHYHIRKDEVLRQCRKWQKELESAVEKYHDDSSILKQIKAQLNRISQLLPTLQHVLYNSIDLSEFDKKEDKEKEDNNGEENA